MGGQTEFVGDLVQALIARHDPSLRLGYQDEGPKGVKGDRPGLLQGMAGILLVLLAVSTDREPAWDRVFALA